VRRAAHEKLIDDLRRAHGREREQWLAERRDLLDRIMYLANRPWTAPPAELASGPDPEVKWDPDVVMPETLTTDELDLLASANHGDE
jgi:hypothetical protein